MTNSHSDLDNSQTIGAAESEELSARASRLEDENTALKENITRNNTLFEAILSNGRDGVLLTGPDMRIVRVFRGLTGVNRASFPGQLIDLLVVPEDRVVVVEAYRQLLDERSGRVEIAVRLSGADGVTRVYEAILTDMLDNPAVAGIVWNYSSDSSVIASCPA